MHNTSKPISITRGDAPDAEAAARGDRRAFVALLTRHRGLVRRVCTRFERDRWEAEDLEQEVWLEAWLAIKRLENPAKFAAWLQGVTVNVGRRWQRRNRRLIGAAAGSSNASRTRVEPRNLAPRSVASANGYERLSPRDRRLLQLKYDARLTYADMARELDTTIPGIRSALYRARRNVRREPVTTDRSLTMASTAEITSLELITIERGDGERRPSGVIKLRDVSSGKHIAMVWDEDAVRLAADALAEQNPKRPMTHDLTGALLRAAGANVENVEISRLTGEIFFATVRLVTERGGIDVDARPSDAINLAIRANARILVSRDVIAAAGKEAHELDGFPDEHGRDGETYRTIDSQRLWPDDPGS